MFSELPYIGLEDDIFLPIPMIALILACLVFVSGLVSMGIFIYRGYKTRYTWTIIALILTNLFVVLFQIFEAFYVYIPYDKWTIGCRNLFYMLSVLSLNLMQLEIISIFNGNLIHVGIFKAENMKALRAFTVIVHVFFALPIYLQGWVVSPHNTSVATKWAVNSAAVYTFMIGIGGVCQNFYILKHTKAHFDLLDSSGASSCSRGASGNRGYNGSSSIGLLSHSSHMGKSTVSTSSSCRKTATSTSTYSSSSSCTKNKRTARNMRFVLFLLFFVDLVTLVVYFTSAMVITSRKNIVIHFALMQITVATMGIHLHSLQKNTPAIALDPIPLARIASILGADTVIASNLQKAL
ncbi:hypothetical protein BATDEDRAFT_25913 [Batrachochytrium dendrobatidis JAM81]|uniref:G-protein coupled receptors family 1 profile domain-containing protein n=1 Tax=Batrachochytrium dendrobatidis (strain JAM81 / FGSC 10211) TaxID=684364 RepID=F4P607_BATDJ|nr:uncharacterized protein BATDEDRAFT_25913 [Batrachochytrium dendrobatidis JAM81]EGF79274.1 hypothetical protein BATDEDRAFT_25913 [Batrachochytrium dendrobatidis JAM81]|eukprot:XP_006679910.1 hypothetical protein BATDEDRAFT_25913 [Batrachochytrium dendrobatidis JAM81]